MPLSEEQKGKLADWLHSKNCNPDCPSCGCNEWSFGDLVTAPHFNKGEADNTALVPMVQLICKNCAFIRSHAAIPIGLLEIKPEETSDPEGTEN